MRYTVQLLKLFLWPSVQFNNLSYIGNGRGHFVLLLIFSSSFTRVQLTHNIDSLGCTKCKVTGFSIHSLSISISMSISLFFPETKIRLKYSNTVKIF